MNLSFIKLDINIMNDSKIKFIRKLPDGDSLLVLWIGILCLGMKSGKPGVVEIGDGIPFTAEMLSTELDIELSIVENGLKTFVQFKMLEIWKDKELFIVNFEKHQNLEKIKMARKKSKATSKKYREKLKKKTAVTVTPSSRYDDVTNSDKTEKELEEEKEIEMQNPCNNKSNILDSSILLESSEFEPENFEPENTCPSCGCIVENSGMCETCEKELTP